MLEISLQDVLNTESTRQVNLGAEARTPEGRTWVYVSATEALSLGHLAQHAANKDEDTLSSSTDNKDREVFVTQTSAGWTAGDYEGDYLLIDDGTGAGQFARIKNNTSDTLELEPEYALSTSLSVSDSDGVIARPYKVRKAVVSNLLGPERGFAQVAFSANDEGWLLKEGPGVAIAGEALTIDEYVTPGDDTAGEIKSLAAGETVDDVTVVGRVLVANASADKGAMVEAHVV